MTNKLRVNIADVLQTDDFSVMHEWELYHNEILKLIEISFKDDKSEILKLHAESKQFLSDLHDSLMEITKEIQSKSLQLKVIEKKNSNALKLLENLTNEIEEAKIRKEQLTLEHFDLQEDANKKKKEKKDKWNALKRAAHIYKTNLNIHLNLETLKNDSNRLSISFFPAELGKGVYEVILLHENDVWKVENISPMPEQTELRDLFGSTGFHRFIKVSDTTIFLCKLRKIFFNHYIKTREKKK